MTDTEALCREFAGTIHRCAANLDSATWHEDAAFLIVHKPAVQAAFTAVHTVTALREAHAPESWGEGSETIVCTTCRSVAWPCPVIDLIDRMEVSA